MFELDALDDLSVPSEQACNDSYLDHLLVLRMGVDVLYEVLQEFEPRRLTLLAMEPDAENVIKSDARSNISL